MPKFATEIAELVTARVTILNIWHSVQLVVSVGCYNDKCRPMGYNKSNVYIEI